MPARILLLMCALFIHNSYSMVVSPGVHVAHHSRSTSSSLPFSAVNIIGNINVHLHTGYAKSSVTLSGDPQDVKNIKLKVIQGELYISLKNPSRHACSVSADIRSQYLNGLVYHGSGSITGTHLRANLERVVIDNQGSTILKGTVRLGYVEVLGSGYTQISGVVSPHLRVKLSGDAKLMLTGVASLRQLEAAGNSWFRLSWVKTPSLVICASDKSYIELAGIVNKLDVQLWNSAEMNARYLRARRAYVKTHDFSVAQISATRHQHTLATDASDIRFYNLPEMKTDFMAFDGAVLDMRAFNTAVVEEPTPYNNQ